MYLYITLFLSIGFYVAFLFKRGGIVQFPFFFSSIALAWLFPQLLSIAENNSISEVDLDRLSFYLGLVLIGVWVGWGLATRDVKATPVDQLRLERSAWVLCGVGSAASIGIRFMPDDVLASSQWSGPVTILVFFSQATFLAAAIASYLWFMKGEKRALIIGGLIILALSPQLFYGFRRAAIGQVLLIPIAVRWFCLRRSVPKSLIVIGTVLAAFLINNIGALRAKSYTVRSGRIVYNQITIEDLAEVSWTTPLLESPAHEAKNAARYMAFVENVSAYDFGASLWDAFVHAFVPAQFVGASLKQALKFETFAVDRLYSEVGYEGAAGATWTGLSDSFQMFWYFGCLLFVAIGYVMTRLYRRGMTGDPHAIVLYSCLIVPGMHALTHFSSHFWVLFATFSIFMKAAFWRPKRREWL